MKELEQHELIEKYLSGKLDGQELADFKGQLDADPDLAQKVEMHRMAEEVIRHGIRKQLKTRLKAIDQEEEPSNTQIRRMRPLRRIAAVLLPFLLIAFAAWLWIGEHFSSDAIAGRYFDHAEQELWRSSANTEATDSPLQQLLEAGNAFDEGNYTTAASILTQIDNPLFKEQAEWNLMLCYSVMEGKSEDFQTLLSRITSQEDHRYNERAKQLQSTLEHPLYPLGFDR